MSTIKGQSFELENSSALITFASVNIHWTVLSYVEV